MCDFGSDAGRNLQSKWELKLSNQCSGVKKCNICLKYAQGGSVRYQIKGNTQVQLPQK